MSETQQIVSPLTFTPLDTWCPECMAAAGKPCRVMVQGFPGNVGGVRESFHQARLHMSMAFIDGWNAAITAVSALKVVSDD